VSVRLHYFTDPACVASWAAEPQLRRLLTEFGAEVQITYVMGGLARDFEGESLLGEWLESAASSGMPVDPRLWLEHPLRTTYPACMAVKAAAEQGPEAQERCLRTLREGLLCFRRRLDGVDALVDVAREAGLDAQRFRIDLASNAIVEAFGADLELARTIPAGAREADGVSEGQGGERLVLPSLRAVGEDGVERWVFGGRPYEEWRGAVEAAGTVPSSAVAPGVLEAFDRFGRLAAPEVAAVCGLAEPLAHAELWRLTAEWRLKAVRVLSGWLWEVT
jgi:predicted DsbA family dithiol-disulfide isomerase